MRGKKDLGLCQDRGVKGGGGNRRSINRPKKRVIKKVEVTPWDDTRESARTGKKEGLAPKGWRGIHYAVKTKRRRTISNATVLGKRPQPRSMIVD